MGTVDSTLSASADEPFDNPQTRSAFAEIWERITGMDAEAAQVRS